MKWGAILHSHWLKDINDATRIIGKWAEDGTDYEIKVPSQLRNQIVEIQNWLCDQYTELKRTREKVCSLEQFFTWNEGIAPDRADAPMGENHEDS